MPNVAKTEKDDAAIAKARSLKHVPWCEQYERMISGMLYNAMVPELTHARFRARRLCHKYNTHFPDGATFDSLTADRDSILRDLLGRVGSEPWVEAPIYIDNGFNVSVGDRFYANFNLTILDAGLVSIGDRCFFGPNVSIYTATHETEVASRRDNREFGLEITIGDDCWFGGNVSILAGVHIGKGCTIGAGSIVLESVPDWSVAVGCPARVVKRVQEVEDARETKKWGA